MKTTKDCISDALLDSIVSGTISSAEEASVQLHLDTCETCLSRMKQRVGDGQWWSDAEELLGGMQDPNAPTIHPDAANAENISSPSAAVVAHLKQWMGPTDDPTKLGRIGSFEVIGIVGVGGAGIVLKAHDARLNRFVAIKTLLPALSHSPIARRRFERESQAVAAITHQNVVPIYAVDTYNDNPYIAMHYSAGKSLQRRLDERGPLEIVEIVRIAAQIARALEAAHAQGVIHRDIKPANIMLEENVDRVLVTDFGLARVVDEASTHSGAITGTPQFMSPEQCLGQPAGQRSDLFSLGSVIYAMCVGRAPFRADTLMGMLRKVCDSDPSDPRDYNSDVPAWLSAFVKRLHHKHPEDRFASAADVAELLEAELAHLQSPATVALPGRSWIPLPTVEKPSANPTVVPQTFVSSPTAFARSTIMPLSILGIIALLATAMTLPHEGSDSTAKQKNASVVAANDAAADRSTFDLVEESTFAVKPGGQLTVAMDFGDIEVATSDVKEANMRVVRTISASTKAEAKKLGKNHVVNFKTNDGNLELVGKADSDFMKTPQRKQIKQVRLVLLVPKQFNVNLTTAGGHIDLGDLDGTVRAMTAGGNIKIEDVKGNVDARTAGGHIAVADVVGDFVAQTAGGNIHTGHVTGTVESITSGGNIVVTEATNTVNALTTGGSVTVALTGQPEGDSKIKTHGGNVTVTLSKDLKVSIDATASVGSVSLLGTRTNSSGKHITKELNGGGPTLVCETTAGNVTVAFADPVSPEAPASPKAPASTTRGSKKVPPVAPVPPIAPAEAKEKKDSYSKRDRVRDPAEDRQNLDVCPS